MKKLSKKQKLALAGVVLYVTAYKAGKRDAISSVTKQVKELEKLNQNIGYIRAMEDVVRKLTLNDN